MPQGEQVGTGSPGLDNSEKYYVFDFWAQKPLGILKGTNRHAMCGMMEISKTSWNKRKKIFAFTADLVAGETMNITIAAPEGKKNTRLLLPKAIQPR